MSDVNAERDNEDISEPLTPKERYDLRKKQKGEKARVQQTREKASKISSRAGKYVLYLGIATLVIAGLGWLLLRVPALPPISAQNHSEASPPAHILETRIPDAIQRHMLEHADGAGLPGIIIQYNCSDFDCEPDLLENLTALVQEYPDNVYLAPNTYSGKIILTRLGERKILDAFDEAEIRNFIGQ